MFNDPLMTFLIAEAAIVLFAYLKSRSKWTGTTALDDANSTDGAAITFNFWFFLLNFLLGAIVFESLLLAAFALGLWIIRARLK